MPDPGEHRAFAWGLRSVQPGAPLRFAAQPRLRHRPESVGRVSPVEVRVITRGQLRPVLEAAVPNRIAPYEVSSEHYDEAFQPGGEPRPGYDPILEAIAESGPAPVQKEVRDELAANEVEFGPRQTRSTFVVDPIPRLIGAAEWRQLETGLTQRVRTLNAFLEDAYSGREIVEAGVLPARVLDESPHFEPAMARSDLPVVAHVAGPDLIRGSDGRMVVLEDNVRTPSGLAYAIAGRAAVTGSPSLPDLPIRGIDDSVGGLLETIRSADPTGTGDPSMAVLSDGPDSNAWFEHRELARGMDLPLISPGDLLERSGALAASTPGGPTRIDVLYNRTSSESLRDDAGRLTGLGEILAGPLESGRLACVNSFGAGIADDKATFCYVEEMIRFYLDEEPKLRSVPSFDLGDPEQFAVAMERLGELVMKPRWSFGGQGIVIGPRASRSELERTAASVRADPSSYVAQEPVEFSVHPTVAEGELEPRHVDFRPYVLTRGEKSSVVPGGLTRFAGAVGDLIVNSTQGGGSKDTWVLADE